MKKLFATIVVLASSHTVHAQVVNTAIMDTTDFDFQGNVTVEAYIDIYYAYNFNQPPTKNQPYFVSMSRDREININLAFIEVKYSSSRLRGRFVPGFGTYINANYAKENGSLKNIVEASAGVKVAQNKNIWLDVGVFGSPYTNESAISKDHLAYTRSFAPEYVPYYLTGAKLTLPLTSRVSTSLYLLNGWQQIQDQNEHLSLGTQLEYRPTDYLLVNWDTYIGDERSAADTTVGKRYFSDVYFIYSKGRFSATSCFYAGIQEQAESRKAFWWQVNLIARYNLTEKLSVTGRFEHFNDPDGVQIVPITGVSGFRTNSCSLGLNYKLAQNVLLRLEGRTFFSDKQVYIKNETPTTTSNSITSNITMWF